MDKINFRGICLQEKRYIFLIRSVPSRAVRSDVCSKNVSEKKQELATNLMNQTLNGKGKYYMGHF